MKQKIIMLSWLTSFMSAVLLIIVGFLEKSTKIRRFWPIKSNLSDSYSYMKVRRFLTSFSNREKGVNLFQADFFFFSYWWTDAQNKVKYAELEVTTNRSKIMIGIWWKVGHAFKLKKPFIVLGFSPFDNSNLFSVNERYCV